MIREISELLETEFCQKCKSDKKCDFITTFQRTHVWINFKLGSMRQDPKYDINDAGLSGSYSHQDQPA